MNGKLFFIETSVIAAPLGRSVWRYVSLLPYTDLLDVTREQVYVNDSQPTMHINYKHPPQSLKNITTGEAPTIR